MTNQIPPDDVDEALQLLQQVKTTADGVGSHLKQVIEQVEQGQLHTSRGISFLEVKNQLLMSYLVNLTHLMTTKVHSKSIKANPTIDRLVEIRTVLEKMRPIDQKLKYQIDKLIKTATTGIGENDPLRLKPNPENLESKLDESDSESGSGSEEQETTKKYKPPKLAAVQYDGDETELERTQKKQERAMKQAMSSSIMREIREEYDDAPEEIRDGMDLHRAKVDKAGKEKQEYEEKYFLRMSESKKQKAASRRLRTMSGLNDLTRFGDISALTGESGNYDDDETPRKKKKVPTATLR